MNDHKSRMNSIKNVAVPPDWTQEGKMIRQFLESERLKDPSMIKKIEECFNKALAISTIQSINGADLFCDMAIRELILEYNNRAFQHGLYTLPASFNVVEAFIEYIPKYNFFYILDEKDHQFSPEAFLDYVTSQKEKGTLGELIELLNEGVIYSYNSIDKLGDFLFSSTDKSYYYNIIGISMIRHESELSILAIFGEEGGDFTSIIDSFPTFRPFNGKETIKSSTDLELKPIYIDENTKLVRTLALARIDLNDETLNARYLLSDLGNSYTILTDDPDAFFSLAKDEKEDREKLLASSRDRLGEKSIVFELCKTLLFLPHFFSTNDDQITIHRHPTKFREFSKKLSNKKTINFTKKRDRISNRNIELIDKIESVHSDYIDFLAPTVRLELKGYYRKLTPNKFGTDKYGNPIRGKTWVEETLKWRESHDTQEIIQASKKRQSIENDSLNYGKIYLIRSETHSENVFKIGKTDRSVAQRVKEISRGTGVFGSFYPLMTWDVKDSDAAEKEIHDRLSEYRITSKREFFHAPIEHIIETIQEVISKINSK